MEHLAIFEKIYDNLSNSLEPGTSIYIFSVIVTNSIYDNWNTGTDFERALAKRLVSIWEGELGRRMGAAYENTKYQEHRPEYDNFCKKWIEDAYGKYRDNKGICYALRNIWEKEYGLRIVWPD
jgi:hypothetical protein